MHAGTRRETLGRGRRGFMINSDQNIPRGRRVFLRMGSLSEKDLGRLRGLGIILRRGSLALEGV